MAGIEMTHIPYKGAGPALTDLISGNIQGLLLTGTTTTANTIAGNYIGTNAAGTGAVANSANGVLIQLGAHDNAVGGTNADEGNLISGNAQSGVAMTSNNASGNLLRCVLVTPLPRPPGSGERTECPLLGQFVELQPLPAHLVLVDRRAE